MVDSCEQCNKLSDYINGEEFLVQLSEYQFLFLLHGVDMFYPGELV